MNVTRLTLIVKWVLISNVVAAAIGIVTLPWRDQLIAALERVGIPQPTPAETIVLFIATIVCFYVAATLAEAESVDGGVRR